MSIVKAGRSAANYADGGRYDGPAGIAVDTPAAGFYRYRMVKGGFPVAVKIWFGQPKDPITGELMDRSLRWQAEINGRPADIDSLWPRVAGSPIDQAEHDYLASINSWAAEHAPDHAAADPRKPIDLMSAPIGF